MASQKSRMINLITKEFGLEYSATKSSERKMKQLQKEFFDAATEMLESQSRARKTVKMPMELVEHNEMQAWVKQHYPGWRLISCKDEDALIEEDAALMAFTYLNPDDRMVYGRTTAQGSPLLDDERLKDEDPDLWEQISDYPEPWASLVHDAIKVGIDAAGTATAGHNQDYNRVNALYELNPSALAANFLRDQGIERVLKPIDELTEEQLQSLQDYLVPAPITVRLVPPRPAKEEELEEAGIV